MEKQMTRKDALAKLGKKLAESWSDSCTCGCTSFEDAYGAGFAAAVELLLPSVVALDFIKTVVEETGDETTTELECHHSAEDALTTLDAQINRGLG